MAEDIGVKIDWNGDAVTAKIRNEIERRMDKAGQYLKREIIQVLGTPSRSAGPAGAGNPPHADTGRLRKSIYHEVQSGTQLFSLVVGTSVLYGKFLELGAVITPGRAKALAIPVSDEAKRHIRNGGKTSNFPKKLVLVGRKGRTAVLIEQIKTKSMRSYGKVHFVLTSRVVLKPRPWLKPTFTKNYEKMHDILFTPPIN